MYNTAEKIKENVTPNTYVPSAPSPKSRGLGKKKKENLLCAVLSLKNFVSIIILI